jgi:hypothetical protein
MTPAKVKIAQEDTVKHYSTLAIAVTTVGLASAAFALPLKVRTEGTKSQSTVMCADCKTKVSCAQVGDYVLGLTVDLESGKVGNGRLIVHVQDKAKAPVTDAKVVANLSMPEHKNAGKALTLKHQAHGQYQSNTNLLNHPGAYRVEVAVTPASGDTVKQVFTFSK